VNADDLIRQVKDRPRFRLEVGLLLDSGAFAEARDLNAMLEQSRFAQEDDVTVAGPQDILDRLLALYRETPEVRFVLEARSATEWETLRTANPDDETFTLALLAECVVEPDGFTLDKVRDLRDSLTAGQWQALVAGVRSVNEGLFDLRPTFAASVLMSGGRQKSNTAPLEDSDILSS
jgi:hypothetical protein